MNVKTYKAYVKNKQNPEEKKTKEVVVDIKDFSKIEIMTRNGNIVGIINLEKYDGSIKLS